MITPMPPRNPHLPEAYFNLHLPDAILAYIAKTVNAGTIAPERNDALKARALRTKIIIDTLSRHMLGVLENSKVALNR